MPADLVSRVSTGSPFEEKIGYSRAVSAGGVAYVSGTTGYDYATMVMPDDVETQCHNTLVTIDRALRELGSGLEHVLKVTYIVPNRADWPLCWPVVSEAFATARPAATMISAALQEPEMKIEIEVIARIP